MNENRFDRRTVIKGALAGLAALPAAGLVREAAAQADLAKLEESDPQAKALGYLHDASKVDAAANPMFKEGSRCGNCLQLQGKEGDEWRPCNIFPGKLVNVNGWCKVWVKKPERDAGWRVAEVSRNTRHTMSGCRLTPDT